MLRLSNSTTLLRHLTSSLSKSPLPPLSLHHHRHLTTTAGNTTTTTTNTDDNEWNDAWETAWLPDDLSGKNTPAPWESDVNFGLPSSSSSSSAAAETTDVDPETTAFVADMNENWDERRSKKKEEQGVGKKGEDNSGGGLYRLENVKKDYRLKKQRIHSGLWMKEIEKLEEAKLGGGGPGDDIEKLLDSCSE